MLRKGVKVKGAEAAPRGLREALVSVFTRAPGEPAAHGLVVECYNPDTAHTATLHLEATELRQAPSPNSQP